MRLATGDHVCGLHYTIGKYFYRRLLIIVCSQLGTIP